MSQAAKHLGIEFEAVCSAGPFHCHWKVSSDSGVLEVVAVTGKFSHAETVELDNVKRLGVEQWFSDFLKRALKAQQSYSNGLLEHGWYWVRYLGLHSNKDVPAEWDGHHWSSTAFAGLPLNSVELLGPISPLRPTRFPFWLNVAP